MTEAEKRRERYKNDPEYRERVRNANRRAFLKRYYEDEEWAEKYRQRMREARRKRRADPAYRAAEREKNRLRQARYRAEQKAAADAGRSSSV